MKGYLSIRETSYKWGISWAIPENAEKPTDPRIKNTKGGGKYDFR